MSDITHVGHAGEVRNNPTGQTKIKLIPIALTLACVGALTPATAATQFGDHVRLSGFGTLGAVTSDNEQDAFVRDGARSGAKDDLSWKVDSKMGLQANVTATPWLSATLQVLAEQRYESSVNAEFEWAFVKVQPLEGLAIRIGRMAPATFMVSDSRNIGFANTTVRMPNEVYSLAMLRKLEGGDVSYSLQFGGTTLTATATAGKTRAITANFDFEGSKTRGLNLNWETDFGTFRVGQLKATIEVLTLNIADPYTFTGVGYQFDDGRYVVAAELVRRRSELAPATIDTNGWYVMGGMRFGNWLPYASIARTTQVSPGPVTVSGKQDGFAVGLRWDAISSAAVKLQWDHADPKGSKGVSFTSPVLAPGAPVRDKTNALSLALDFVF